MFEIVVVGKSKHIFRVQYFSEYCAVYEVITKNLIELDRLLFITVICH